MMIKSATVLRNDYDRGVRLSKEERETELDLLAEMLRREQNRVAGVRTFTMDDMRNIAVEQL